MQQSPNLTTELSVATSVWTALTGTDIEVMQMSGGNSVAHENRLGSWILPTTAGPWMVRRSRPDVQPDDHNYVKGQQAVGTLLDIATHTVATLRTLLAQAQEAMVTAHYNRQNERYALAKGMADSIRDYLGDQL